MAIGCDCITISHIHIAIVTRHPDVDAYLSLTTQFNFTASCLWDGQTNDTNLLGTTRDIISIYSVSQTIVLGNLVIHTESTISKDAVLQDQALLRRLSNAAASGSGGGEVSAGFPLRRSFRYTRKGSLFVSIGRLCQIQESPQLIRGTAFECAVPQ